MRAGCGLKFASKIMINSIYCRQLAVNGYTLTRNLSHKI